MHGSHAFHVDIAVHNFRKVRYNTLNDDGLRPPPKAWLDVPDFGLRVLLLPTQGRTAGDTPPPSHLPLQMTPTGPPPPVGVIDSNPPIFWRTSPVFEVMLGFGPECTPRQPARAWISPPHA